MLIPSLKAAEVQGFRTILKNNQVPEGIRNLARAERQALIKQEKLVPHSTYLAAEQGKLTNNGVLNTIVKNALRPADMKFATEIMNKKPTGLVKTNKPSATKTQIFSHMSTGLNTKTADKVASTAAVDVYPGQFIG